MHQHMCIMYTPLSDPEDPLRRADGPMPVERRGPPASRTHRGVGETAAKVTLWRKGRKQGENLKKKTGIKYDSPLRWVPLFDPLSRKPRTGENDPA